MITKHKTTVSKDSKARKITVVKELDAVPQDVWNAWTDSNTLEKWWAPKPWCAETKQMDFREGGTWLYSMVGPKGERHWSSLQYKTIDEPRRLTTVDSFTDDQGTKTADMPSMRWTIDFNETDTGTKLQVEVNFDTEADMKKILDTGFEEGFKMALDNLEELLSE